MILTLQPLLGAIAAGCCAVLKPSEVAPAYAKLIAELIPKYLDPSAYRVVNGSVNETTKLLELSWDHSTFLVVVSISISYPPFQSFTLEVHELRESSQRQLRGISLQ
jgi:hypothetical protein